MLTGFSTSRPCCGFALGSELCRSEAHVTRCDTSTDGQKSVRSTRTGHLVPPQLSTTKRYASLEQMAFGLLKRHPNLPIPPLKRSLCQSTCSQQNRQLRFSFRGEFTYLQDVTNSLSAPSALQKRRTCTLRAGGKSPVHKEKALGGFSELYAQPRT